MNFVPLDVLTAAEQNQLVANIEYIANQFPITSANIGSQAVKSSNIDWASTVQEGAITMNTGWTAGSDTYCRKQGNIVQWSMKLTGSSTMVTNTTYVVGRLPAGFIPVADTAQTGIYRLSTQAPVIVYCVVYGVSGNILVCSPIDIPSGGIRTLSGTFITA